MARDTPPDRTLETSLLISGSTVTMRPTGKSMIPIIHPGQQVTIEPYRFGALGIGDVVWCRVKRLFMLHRVSGMRIERRGSRYLITNAKGTVNGWVRREAIYGLVTKIQE